MARLDDIQPVYLHGQQARCIDTVYIIVLRGWTGFDSIWKTATDAMNRIAELRQMPEHQGVEIGMKAANIHTTEQKWF